MSLDLNLIVFWLTSLLLTFTVALLITRGRTRPEPQICGSVFPWELPGSQPNRFLIEVELPEIPRYIRVDDPAKLSKLLRDLGVLEEDNEEASRPQVDNEGRDVFHGNQGVSSHREASFNNETVESFSTRRHHDNPLLDVIEMVSGLEFSPDGGRVKCPLHGWTTYTVTSTGDIVCNSGPHLLWSFNILPRKEFMEMVREAQMELSQLENEAVEEKKRKGRRQKPRDTGRIEDIEDEDLEETREEEVVEDEEDSA